MKNFKYSYVVFMALFLGHDPSVMSAEPKPGEAGGGASSMSPEQVESLSQPLQTQTPAFKEWFGDSQVVDGNGNPKIVYV